jgi:DNA repair photolyase
MESLFPQIAPQPPLVGIARLAAEGEAVGEGHDVDYLSIECRSILTRCRSPRMPFAWMINPYRGCEFACKYCYARYTHEFMEMRDGLDFERKIFVKQQSAWLLRRELKRVRQGESIAIGTATDPYQPAERNFKITRTLLEEFSLHRGLSIGLVTKSNLILRDLELLKAVAAGNQLTICMTVTTMDMALARALEPRAPRPDLRMLALRKLVEAGLRAGVNCAPVLPGITDSPASLEAVVLAAAQARAHFVYANPLFLKPCAAKVFMPFLEEKFPAVAPTYRARYAGNAFLPAPYQRRITSLVKKLCAKYMVGTLGLSARGNHAPCDEDQMPLFNEAQP